jgi:hypothetical protein
MFVSLVGPAHRNASAALAFSLLGACKCPKPFICNTLQSPTQMCTILVQIGGLSHLE